MSSNDKFQDGEAYQEPRQKTPASILAKPLSDLNDYANVRSQTSLADIASLIPELTQKGVPLDDRKGTTEKLIGMLTALPSTSDNRTQVTKKFITTLWENLQHPPLSYVGSDVKYEVVNSNEPTHKSNNSEAGDSIEFKVPDSDVILREHIPREPDGLYQYRMPDGSFNNILQPNLGKAGTAYAKTVKPEKCLHGVKPDPGLHFDLLLARDEETFKENPAGISSMLFYHASIIIHDIFRTNRMDMNKSDVSSYLDLAPLYGSSLRDQLEVRTMKEGKLKPDTFHEKRLLGQPAGVNVMLVLYSRFHNYVADILLKINENGRFTLACTPNASPEDKAQAMAKQDHDLFNTARLIVGGLYINICLHDYLRAITNTHHSASDWTLDPRVEISNQAGGESVPRGVGNQVSVEFNLLYRFHACISQKDERWMNDFFLKLFPDRSAENLKDISWTDLGQALVTFENSIPKDPSLRTFDGLQRQADGRFKDEDLVRILKEATDDPAGVFGARMVPKALKIVEVLGINQARKWQVASLNEFREFFGLKRYEKFTDMNSDTEIAGILEKLYTSPDMVELYPGLMIEDIKPARAPGCGSTGVTFTLSVLQDIAQRAKTHKILPLRTLHLTWVIKHQSWISWVSEELRTAFSMLQEAGVETLCNIHITGEEGIAGAEESAGRGHSQEQEKEQDDEVDGQPVPDDEKAEVSESHNRRTSDADISFAELHVGRPTFQTMLERRVNQAQGETAVAVCGPLGLSVAVRSVVVRISDDLAVDKGNGLDGLYLHVENFD